MAWWLIGTDHLGAKTWPNEELPQSSPDPATPTKWDQMVAQLLPAHTLRLEPADARPRPSTSATHSALLREQEARVTREAAHLAALEQMVYSEVDRQSRLPSPAQVGGVDDNGQGPIDRTWLERRERREAYGQEGYGS